MKDFNKKKYIKTTVRLNESVYNFLTDNCYYIDYKKNKLVKMNSISDIINRIILDKIKETR